jgi:hypothetical protein
MFKEFSQGLNKFFTTQRIILLLVFVILAFVLYNYSDVKKPSKDGYTGSVQSLPVAPPSTQHIPPASSTSGAPENVFVQNNGAVVPDNVNQGGYVPKNTGAPSDLLPKGQSGQFSDFNMLNQGNIAMPDLLDAGYLIGLDTIGQTLRNANYQERSDPIIPKVNIGPWNNSTIEPDLGRVPLELGCGIR